MNEWIIRKLPLSFYSPPRENQKRWKAWRALSALEDRWGTARGGKQGESQVDPCFASSGTSGRGVWRPLGTTRAVKSLRVKWQQMLHVYHKTWVLSGIQEIISILHHLGDYFAIPSHFDLVSRETLINKKIQFIKSNISWVWSKACYWDVCSQTLMSEYLICVFVILFKLVI